MILYFDNYITEESFYGNIHNRVGEIRHSLSLVYKFHNKLKITLYTLASYAEIKWSEVIIKYELENIKHKGKFEREVKKLFPKAHIIYGRSDNQKKFQESAKLMNTFKDEWIFYAGNNDHPFMAQNKKTLNACLKEAKKLKKKNKWVSILISHFPQFYNVVRKGSPYREIAKNNVQLFKEGKEYFATIWPKGQYHSMQIIHKDLFNRWVHYKDAKNTLIRRSEDLEPFTKVRNQVGVIPKKELCAHYDGEIFPKRSGWVIPEDLFVPLFIPPGFFEKKIKIRFGYNDYKEGWVNINPLKKEYSFRDKVNGTDLMIDIKDIPLFWKKRIKKIDINPEADKKALKKARDKRFEKIKDPFLLKGNLYWIFYRFKKKVTKLSYNIPFIGKFISKLFEKNPLLEKIYVFFFLKMNLREK